MNDQTTIIIAIIGCVTGVAGLLINFYKILSELPKIVVSVVDPELNGFWGHIPEYQSDHSVLINLRLSNIGRTPLSIRQVVLKHKKLFAFQYYPAPIPVLSFDDGNGGTLEYRYCKKAELPLFMDVGSVCDVSFIFPFADDLFKLISGKEILRLNAVVYTGSSKISTKLDLHELTYENIKNYTTKHKKRIII